MFDASQYNLKVRMFPFLCRMVKFAMLTYYLFTICIFKY